MAGLTTHAHPDLGLALMHNPQLLLLDEELSRRRPLALALDWAAVLIVAVGLVLRRTVGSRG